MKFNKNDLTVRASLLAVRGALIAMAMMPAAYAAEEADAGPTAAELSQPTSSVEIGIGNVDKGDAKFGEYNGLENKGAYGIGKIDLRAGGAYDSDSAMRWRITGSDLGLDTRNINAQFGQQGKFRIELGFDQLNHNISDSYMTPYNGAGTGSLTLPSNWETNKLTCKSGTAGNTGNTNFNGTSNATVGTQGCGNYFLSGTTSATITANALALTAAELADFHQVDLYTERKNYRGGISYEINPQLQASASVSHETKKGVMAIGQAFGGGTSAQVTVPNPIDYTTDQYNLALAFTGDKGFAKLAGYASIFKNDISSVSVQNPWYTNATSSAFPNAGSFSGAPSNDYYQVNFTGGYNFTPSTKLVTYAAYSRNTQNQTLQLADTVSPTANGFTNPAFDGKVITKAVNLKLTSRPIDKLNVSAAYKYDDRNNKSTSGVYEFRWTDQQTGTPLEAINTPYGRTTHVVNLDANYALKEGHAIGAGYEYSNLSRKCSGELDAITSGCINVDSLKENTVRVEYRNNAFETLSGRVSYAYGQRDASAYRRNANGAEGAPGTVLSDIADDFLTRFNSTDRTRNKVRASLDWQPKDALDISASLDYIKDNYDLGRNPTPQEKYSNIAPGVYAPLNIGLDASKTWVLNLDGSLKVNEKLSVNAYYTYENKDSQINGQGCTSIALTSTTSYCTAGNYPFNSAAWSANTKDRIDTVGVGFKLQPVTKLELMGDYVMSHSNSPYGLVAGGQYAYANTLTQSTTSAVFASTSGLPLTDTLSGVYSDSDTVKLSAKYTMDKHSAVRLNFAWQKLTSGDPTRYEGLQQGTAQAYSAGSTTAKVNGVSVGATQVVPIAPLMPTNESSPDYSLYVVGATYIYSF